MLVRCEVFVQARCLCRRKWRRGKINLCSGVGHAGVVQCTAECLRERCCVVHGHRELCVIYTVAGNLHRQFCLLRSSCCLLEVAVVEKAGEEEAEWRC